MGDFEIDIMLSYEGEGLRPLVAKMTFNAPFYLSKENFFSLILSDS